jgi:hypothetical protein
MMLCDGYCDKYDACDEYYDIYDACNEYYEMHIMPVIFWYFLEDAQQSDQNQQQKQCLCRAFVALAHDKEPSLLCVFGFGARQRAFFAVRFSRCTAKGVKRRLIPAPSVAFFCRAPRKNARQILFAVRCQMRRTAKGLYRAKCYRAPFAVRPDEKRTAICRAFLGLCPAPMAHGKAAVSRSA